jgi:hypothetical protein
MLNNEEIINSIFEATRSEKDGIEMASNGKKEFHYDEIEVPITKDIFGLTALDVILGV